MTTDAIVLHNRHTGERLELRRFTEPDGTVSLSMHGSLPPHQEGPPLHIHHDQDEEGRVLAGTLSAEVDGRRFTAGPGEAATLPKGLPHRWWNEGDEELRFEGVARPAGDLDRYLQAVFDVANAGPHGRPSLFHMAYVMWRHRRGQEVLLMPRPLQAVVWPLIVLVGTLLGRYRGASWPGAPGRYVDAPM